MYQEMINNPKLLQELYEMTRQTINESNKEKQEKD